MGSLPCSGGTGWGLGTLGMWRLQLCCPRPADLSLSRWLAGAADSILDARGFRGRPQGGRGAASALGQLSDPVGEAWHRQVRWATCRVWVFGEWQAWGAGPGVRSSPR